MLVKLNITNYSYFRKKKTIVFTVPNSWKEVPQKYFIEIYSLLPFLSEKWAIIKLLSFFLKSKYIHLLAPSFIEDVFVKNIEKLKTDLSTAPFTKLSLYNKKIQLRLFGNDFTIKLPFKNYYYLPKQHLQDLTFGEVASGLKQVIIYFNKNGKGTAEQNLNSAMAIFCRPQKSWLFSVNKKTFKRQEFDIVETEPIAEDMQTIPYAIKLFVVNYVLANLEKIKAVPKLKILFPKPKEEENETETEDFDDIGIPEFEKQTKKDPNVWYDFIIDIAETGLCGDFQKVQTSNFIEVLMIAAKKKQDIVNAEMERKMRN